MVKLFITVQENPSIYLNFFVYSRLCCIYLCIWKWLHYTFLSSYVKKCCRILRDRKTIYACKTQKRVCLNKIYLRIAWANNNCIKSFSIWVESLAMTLLLCTHKTHPNTKFLKNIELFFLFSFVTNDRQSSAKFTSQLKHQ